MGDLSFNQASQAVQVVGNTEGFAASVNDLNELGTVEVIKSSGVNGALTVGTSAVEIKVGASRLVNRKSLTIYNNSTSTIYWGYSSGVTTANGSPLNKGEFASFAIADIGLFAIAGSAGNNVRVTEGA